MKACIVVVWRGEKSLHSDPGSELRLGREKGGRKSGKIIEAMSKGKKNYKHPPPDLRIHNPLHPFR